MHPAIRNFTTQAFDIKHYKDFITYAFGDEEGLELMQESYKNPNDHSKYTYTKLKQEYCLLPEPIEGGGGQTLEVYAFKVESIHARVGLYKDLKEKLRDTGSHALLACLFQENSPHFRLSLITRSLNEKGEIDYSHPKRQSFLLGKDIKTRSAQDQLSKLQGASSLEDIEEAFSLEQLSREFFQAITKHFTHLYENIKFPKTLNEEASRAFSLRLLARVLFCKFLERKGLIPSGIWDTSLSEHYYHEVLEPLFFGTLNTPKSERNYGLLDSKITHLLDSIPYLNGGLFSPQENDFYDPKSPQAYINTLQVPTTILTELFKNLSEFHFTLDESTPIDQEVGLDPEMLGMVFENLLSMLFTDNKIDNLSSLRKQTGSYYTPREIVSYMAKSCILEYLKTHTTISDSSLRSLVFEYEHEFGYQEILSLLTALSGFRVLDPACGSGAFPMGILQELTQILEALDEEGTAFMALQSQEFKASHQDKDPRYIRKLHILQNNIYGVDIQPMATEISRLRCFLSLICDEDKNKIEPLPNLEFKFLTANSLLPLTQEKQLNYAGFTTDMKQIQAIRQDFLLASTQEKDKLKESYLKLRDKIAKETFATSIAEDNPLLNYNPFDSQSKAEFFDPVFMFGVEKFDCVIGNPPYVRQEAIKKQKPKLQEHYPHTYHGQADLYVYFYERGYQILREGGLLSYITSNKYTRAGYGKHLRTFLLKNTQILSYIDFNGAKVFESASVDTSIMTFAKTSPSSTHYLSYLSCQDKSTLKDATHFTPLAQSSLSVESFSFASQDALALKAKIESTGTPLKEWDIAINRGILTGYNEAFIITTPKREEILSACKDKDERQRTSQLIKKILRGRDIQRYGYAWAEKWLIFIPWHFPNTRTPKSFEANEQDLKNQYPALYEYLLTHKSALSARNKSETGITYEWYCLQRWAANYHEDFEKEKIVWNRISTEICFSYDCDASCILDSMFLITSPDKKTLRLLLGVLNSNFSKYWIKGNAATLGKGFYGAKIYIEKIPIPKIDSTNQSIADKIIALVEEILEKKKQDSATDTTELESQINALVYTLYNLTDEEMELIEKG